MGRGVAESRERGEVHTLTVKGGSKQNKLRTLR